MERTLNEFWTAIESLPLSSSYRREDLLIDRFRLEREGDLEVFYAPFDFVNSKARLALVGVTPGWTQMNASFVEARAGINELQTHEQILRRVKRDAAFSGSLRVNLVEMLDGVGLPNALGLSSVASLFSEEQDHLLHSTSAVRYPVFKTGKNYAGSSPRIADSPLLIGYLEVLATELEMVDEAIVVPLGRSVETALRILIDEHKIDESRCLFDFPHPSGANARRAKQYKENHDRLYGVVQDWFDR